MSEMKQIVKAVGKKKPKIKMGDQPEAIFPFKKK